MPTASETIYKKALELKTKEIDGRLMISIPKTEGPIKRDVIYMINRTGHAIWKCVDGKTSVKKIIYILSQKYNAPSKAIKNDVISMLSEFLEKELIIPVQ